jgi:hypothetical protein
LYRCNRTATVVLSAIAAGKPLDEAVAALCEKFGVDGQVVRRDVDALVATLRARKLVCDAA